MARGKEFKLRNLAGGGSKMVELLDRGLLQWSFPVGSSMGASAEKHTSVVSRKYLGIRAPMHPCPPRCSSVKYHKGILPPRALLTGRLDALGATRYLRDTTLVR